MRALLRWIFGIREVARPRSVLRQILLARKHDERELGAALLEAAMQVQRAQLAHLVTEATGAEIAALADAGDLLAQERSLRLVKALLDPADAFAFSDGGRMKRELVMGLARAEANHGG